MEDLLAAARDQLVARLSAEIRPERRALLSRGELAKMVDAAVQAYFVRHAIDANPLAAAISSPTIMLMLLNPGRPAEQEASSAKRFRTGRRSRRQRRRSSRSSSNTWMSPPPPRCRAPPSRRS